jgi:uncharacterized membrane protein YqjE
VTTPSGDPGRTPDATSPDTSIGALFADVAQDMSLLMRQELELAKAELRESAAGAARGAGLLGGAAVGAQLGLVFVSVAVWWGLGNGIGRAWSALVVAVFWLLVAAVLAAVGRNNLEAVRGLPRTTTSVKQIPDAVKGKEGVR